MGLNKYEITLLVDWDTARRLLWLTPSLHTYRLRSKPVDVFIEIYNMIAAQLTDKGMVSALVRTRVYHGWHQGNEQTPDHRAIIQMDGRENLPSSIGRVSFQNPPIPADRLACDGRFATLRDTMRLRESGGKQPTFEQKMIDTALASDLLFLGRSANVARERFLILGEDDDLLPPIIVMERWRVPAWLMRTRAPNRCMQGTRELIWSLS